MSDSPVARLQHFSVGMGPRAHLTCRAVLLLLAIALVALVVSLSISGKPVHSNLAESEEKRSPTLGSDGLHRSQFPDNFVFGSSTSAFQIEGAIHEGGRGPSVWENFTALPGKISDGTTPNIAADSYHRYEEDIDVLKSMHMDAYRFSIAWTRIFPDGIGPEVNQEGIAYYNRLIDAVIRTGLQPYVTIYHWDLPQHLYDSFGGWLSREIVDVYAKYAEVCFATFGDRVKHWVTLNEPGQHAWQSYGVGSNAPGRTSDRTLSPVGNTSTEPYIVLHHQLLAHGAAVDVYRRKFQATQGGVIGIVADGEWGVPFSDSAEDVKAAERRILFQYGWIFDPIIFGDYPAVMRERVGARLPTFSDEESAVLRNSIDFIGLNHYTTKWILNDPNADHNNYMEDQGMTRIDTRDGIAIGPRAFSSWLRVVPSGIQEMLVWVWERYQKPVIVTENGMDTENTQALSDPLPADALNDVVRLQYHQAYLAEVLVAIRRGVDLRGYFTWALLDNFEWQLGFTSRFGLVYVDYATQNRYPKLSSQWFANLLDRGRDGDNCREQRLGFSFLNKLMRLTGFL